MCIIEEFVWNVLTHSQTYPLTLEDVRNDMEELERNWDDALETAKKFHEEHGELVTPAHRSTNS
jgi:hypothetical protein